MPKPTSLEKKTVSWKHVLGSWAIYAYTLFLGWTTRIYWFKTDEFLQLEKEGKNYIYSIWHNQQLFLLYPYRGQKICSLISLSDDGEFIALRHESRARQHHARRCPRADQTDEYCRSGLPPHANP